MVLYTYFITCGIANDLSAIVFYISHISMQADTFIYTSSFVCMVMCIYNSRFLYICMYIHFMSFKCYGDRVCV